MASGTISWGFSIFWVTGEATALQSCSLSYYFAPLYPIPNSFIKEIAKCCVDIAHNHKPECNFNLTREQINEGEIENQDNQPVPNGFQNGSTKSFFCMTSVRKKFFYHDLT
jgi:hypothetical protein